MFQSLVAFAALLLADARQATADLPPVGSNRRVLQQGDYHPGPYYSTQYLKAFPLEPGQIPLYARLRPYQWYGQHRLGVPFGNLADGSIHSDLFPYRYQPYFSDRHPDDELWYPNGYAKRSVHAWKKAEK